MLVLNLDKMPVPPESPIIFTRHESIQPLEIVGYKRHLDAGVSMGRKALEGNSEYRVLLAGYPGTGKTVYPQVLARKLPDYSLLYIKCNSLMRIGDSDEILRRLTSTESFLTETPLIIAFDELDLLAPSRIIRPLIYTILTGAMMDILDLKPKRTLTFVMANYPLNLDMAINNRLPYTFFFDLPDKETLGETLAGLKVPNPHEVGTILYEMAEKSNGRLVTRSVVNACREVQERTDNPINMAKLLFPHATQFDSRQIEEYERLHRGFKMRSDAALEYWEKVVQ